jgi:hypothetical protein
VPKSHNDPTFCDLDLLSYLHNGKLVDSSRFGFYSGRLPGVTGTEMRSDSFDNANTSVFRQDSQRAYPSSPPTNTVSCPHLLFPQGAHLFHGHPSLIQVFNMFLPVGYRIEVGSGAQSSEVITVTTRHQGPCYSQQIVRIARSHHSQRHHYRSPVSHH